jgi:hypothetical protein
MKTDSTGLQPDCPQSRKVVWQSSLFTVTLQRRQPHHVRKTPAMADSMVIINIRHGHPDLD